MADYSKTYPLLGTGEGKGITLTLQTASTTAVTAQYFTLPLSNGHVAAVPIRVKIWSVTGGETVALYGTTDGTNYSAALIPIDVTTGNFAASAALAAGEYELPIQWNFMKLKTVKSAGVGPCEIAVACASYPKS